MKNRIVPQSAPQCGSMVSDKRRKKRVRLGLLLALTALLLCGCCGCGRGKGKDYITLRWVTYSATGASMDAKEVIEAANKVSREKLGIEVELEFQPSDRINLMMASGEYYDMVFTSYWLNSFDKNAEAGLYYDITDLVEHETPALYKSIGKYWDCARIGGRIMGVPILKDMGAEEMFRLNADYYEEKKGMQIPERSDGLASLEPYLEAYKEDYPNKYPLAMDKSGVPGFFNCVETIAGGIIVIPYNQKTKIPQAMSIWDCDLLMDRYRTLHSWYKKGYIHPDAATIDSTNSDKSIPVRFGVAWKGYMGYSNPEQWGFHVKTSTYEGPFLSRQSEQGAMFGICAACTKERAIECLKYIELLSTDRKFRDILAYGIEGEHFEYLENGTVLQTQKGIDRYPANLYTTGSVVNASVESISREVLSDPDQWKKVYEEYETDGIYSQTRGFYYDITRMESTVTALQAIYSDYSTELRTGTSDPDVVMPKMKKRMEAAGFNELLEDVQNQLNEWMEKSETKQTVSGETEF